MKLSWSVDIIWINLFQQLISIYLKTIYIYIYVILQFNTMFDGLNVEWKKTLLACVHTCVKVYNNIFKLLCDYIVILN
jgi:hypothetical protein